MLWRRTDDLELRSASLATREELDSMRPELTGAEVMQQLQLSPGPMVGKALAFLREIRLEEGLLGEAAIRRRLDDWWRDERSE